MAIRDRDDLIAKMNRLLSEETTSNLVLYNHEQPYQAYAKIGYWLRRWSVGKRIYLSFESGSHSKDPNSPLLPTINVGPGQ